MRIFMHAGAAALAASLAVAGCAGNETAVTQTGSTMPAGPATTTASGLQVIDTQPGTGPSPRPRQTAVMHYTGWLSRTGRRARNSTPPSTAARRSSFPSA